MFREIFKWVTWLITLVAVDLGLTSHAFYAIPISPLLHRWLVRTKKSKWISIRLRPRTSDLSVFNQVFIEEEYMFSRIKRTEEIKKYQDGILGRGERPLIIDCGAYIGLSGIYFKGLFPNAMVLAVEPDPENFESLKRNLGPLDIQGFHAAVSNQKGFTQEVAGSSPVNPAILKNHCHQQKSNAFACKGFTT
jgi:hypothetical protein